MSLSYFVIIRHFKVLARLMACYPPALKLRWTCRRTHFDERSEASWWLLNSPPAGGSLSYQSKNAKSWRERFYSSTQFLAFVFW